MYRVNNVHAEQYAYNSSLFYLNGSSPFYLYFSLAVRYMPISIYQRLTKFILHLFYSCTIHALFSYENLYTRICYKIFIFSIKIFLLRHRHHRCHDNAAIHIHLKIEMIIISRMWKKRSKFLLNLWYVDVWLAIQPNQVMTIEPWLPQWLYWRIENSNKVLIQGSYIGFVVLIVVLI